MDTSRLSEIVSAWAKGKTPSSLPVRQKRDLTFMDLGGGMSLVVACDSLGAIGSKKGDILQVSFQTVGRFTARVALFELIAAGAAPLALVNTLSVEMEPCGRQVLEGIRAELARLGLGHIVPITGSTEENMPTQQTGMGVVAIGAIANERIRIGKARPGDDVYCIGLPKVGEEVSDDDPEMLGEETVLGLGRADFVHDLLPVGSQGIAHEASELARSAGLRLEMGPGCPLDLKKSAGPATCAVAALPPAAAEQVGYVAGEPVTWIAKLL